MEKKLFGTDGIRGRANQYPLTVEMIAKIGMAIGTVLKKTNHRNDIVIGKDTRISGYMIENALTAGLNAVGIDVLLLGPIPTPGVAMLTKSMRCDLGIMISASHNPFYDNGIKLFNSNGVKFPDDIELEIEKCIENNSYTKFIADDKKIGKRIVSENHLYQQRYIQFAKSTFPRDTDLVGIKIVVDCANGATYKIAPIIFKELGANVIPISNNPNGLNINECCGSTDVRLLQKTVIEEKADIGIALDGDGDRIIIVDENGKEIDGDKIIALIAKRMFSSKELMGNTVVITQMSNLGLELYLKSLSIDTVRTKVGDRYVAEEMRKNGYNLGGEQSGHIILGNYSTTGDGIITALQILSILKEEKNQKISKIIDLYKSVPQLLQNINYDKNKEDPLKNENVKKIISLYEEKLKNNGRLLIRKSGTQPLIRVMIESYDEKIMKESIYNITEEIKKYS